MLPEKVLPTILPDDELKLNSNYATNDQVIYDSNNNIIATNINSYFAGIRPQLVENKKKLLCIISAMNLIKLLTAEFQENPKIYTLINSFFEILSSRNWIKNYI